MTNSEPKIMHRRFSPMPVEAVAPRLGRASSSGLPKITGYAAVFYTGRKSTQYELGPGLIERIHPEAFNRALRDRDDVRGLFNHNSDLVLGRSTAGTLALSVDSRGLRYEISPPDTTVARDLIENLRAGNVTGSSFAFSIDEETWTREGNLDIREVRSVRLYDVGPVTYPAYEATVAGADRASAPALAPRSSEDDGHRHRVKTRMRILELDMQLMGVGL